MKKLILTIIPMLFSIGIFGQSFDYLYDTDDEVKLYDVIESNNFYRFIGSKGKTNASYYEALSITLNKDGVLINESNFKNVDGYFLATTAETDSSIFLAFQLPVVSAGKPQLIYREYTKDFSKKLNQYEVFDTNVLTLFGFKLVNDSLLIGYGLARNSQFQPDGFVHKLNLNTLNANYLDLGIGNNNSQIDFVSNLLYMGNQFYIFKSIDNSTIANCNTYIELSRYNLDFTLDTTEAICNSISQQSSTGRNFFYFASALKINDNKFMMSARCDVNADHSIVPNDICLLTWDTNFTELNAASFGKPDTFAIGGYHLISRNQEDSFVYVGGTESYEVNSSGYDTSDSYYMLSKSDLDGNVLWTRYYSNNSYLQLWKVFATSDGGCLMVGTSYDEKRGNGLEKDIWILKVDKNGNSIKTGIGENGSIAKETFLFYPNPVKNTLYFKQINVQRNYTLAIFDLTGRKIIEQKISSSQTAINVSPYAKGTYVYHLIDEQGNFATGKIVKQ